MAVKTIAHVVVGLVLVRNVFAKTPCLPDAIPAQDRQNITVNEVSMPVGIFGQDWASGYQIQEVVKILLEEAMGLNAKFTGIHSSATGAWMALAGCSSYNSVEPCAPEKTTLQVHHVTFEIWEGMENNMMEKLGPELFPAEIGSIGYDGIDGIHLSGHLIQAAYNSTGTMLEYFRSYDVKWNKPWEWFVPSSEIHKDAEKLFKTCEEVDNFNDPNLNTVGYADVVGDYEGLIKQGDQYIAKCWDKYYWRSPACRDKPETCITTMKAGNGWATNIEMQLSVWWNMPLQIAVAKDYAAYEHIPHDYDVISYWWMPDLSFADILFERIVFPTPNKKEQAVSNWRTATLSKKLKKVMWKYLPEAAPLLVQFLEMVTVDMNDMMAMLRQSSVLDYYGAACEWVTKNRAIWEKWLPDQTNCFNGQGLITANGTYLAQKNESSDALLRASAARCEFCLPGKFSMPLKDDVGTTQTCEPCPEGHVTELPGQSACTPCDGGHYMNKIGQKKCNRCRAGFFQSDKGQSFCKVCPQDTTTKFEAATLEDDCVCPGGYYRPLGLSNITACQKCPDGMTCAVGSDMRDYNLKREHGGVATETVGRDLVYPLLNKRYYSFEDDPLHVYYCLDEDSCPGGEPGTCAEKLNGIACAVCDEGYYKESGECKSCTEIEMSKFLFPILPLILGPVVASLMYWRMRDPPSRWGSNRNGLAILLFLSVSHYQTITLVARCNLVLPTDVKISWTGWDYLVDFMTIFRPGCAGFAAFDVQFALQLCAPLFVAIIFFITFCGSHAVAMVNGRREIAMDKNIVFNTFMSVVYTFFLGIAALSFSLFKCYDHPNQEASLIKAPEFLCYTEQWNSMQGGAVFAILFYVCFVIVVFSYVLWLAPMKFADVIFQRRWKFLLAKFNHSAWWWGVILLVKGLSLNLANVLWKSGAAQLCWIQASLIVYTGGLILFKPWRHPTSNAFDVMMHGSLQIVIPLSSWFSNRASWMEPNIGTAMIAVSFFPLLVFAVIAAYLARIEFQQKSNPTLVAEQHSILAKEVQEWFGKVVKADHQDCYRFISRLTHGDQDKLREASKVISAELCGLMPRIPRLLMYNLENHVKVPNNEVMPEPAKIEEPNGFVETGYPESDAPESEEEVDLARQDPQVKSFDSVVTNGIDNGKPPAATNTHVTNGNGTIASTPPALPVAHTEQAIPASPASVAVLPATTMDSATLKTMDARAQNLDTTPTPRTMDSATLKTMGCTRSQYQAMMYQYAQQQHQLMHQWSMYSSMLAQYSPRGSDSQWPGLSPRDHPSVSHQSTWAGLSPRDHPSVSHQSTWAAGLSPRDHPSIHQYQSDWQSTWPNLSPRDYPSSWQYQSTWPGLSPREHPSTSQFPSKPQDPNVSTSQPVTPRKDLPSEQQPVLPRAVTKSSL